MLDRLRPYVKLAPAGGVVVALLTWIALRLAGASYGPSLVLSAAAGYLFSRWVRKLNAQ